MVRLDNSTAVRGQVSSLDGTDGTKGIKEQGGSAQAVSDVSKRQPTADAASVSSAGSAVAQAASGSDVRADKVAALQAAIANGTYNVPASAVADKLISSLLGVQ